MCVRCSW